MDTPNEISELKELSHELAPAKNKCKVCKIIFLVTLILFICSVLLALLTLGTPLTKKAPQVIVPPPPITAEQSSQRIQVLRDYIYSQRGSSTIIIGNPGSK